MAVNNSKTAFKAALEQQTDSSHNEEVLAAYTHLWEVEVDSLDCILDPLCAFEATYPEEVKTFSGEPFAPREMKTKLVETITELQAKAGRIAKAVGTGDFTSMQSLVKLDIELYLLLSFYAEGDLSFGGALNAARIASIAGMDECVYGEVYCAGDELFSHLCTFAISL